MTRTPIDHDEIAQRNAEFQRREDDRLRGEATSKVDWNGGGHVYNWRDFIGPQTRGIWHTLSDDQKFALAKDALAFAMRADEAAWEASERPEERE